MVQIPNVSPKNALGFVDKFVGLGKELFGELLNRDNLVQAGEAQQTKGTEKLKALRAQAEASQHDAKAKASESRQRAAQGSKS